MSTAILIFQLYILFLGLVISVAFGINSYGEFYHEKAPATPKSFCETSVVPGRASFSCTLHKSVGFLAFSGTITHRTRNSYVCCAKQ